MNLGQYFTTSFLLQDAVFELIQNTPSVILEPSMSRGDLIQHVASHGGLESHIGSYPSDATYKILKIEYFSFHSIEQI